jgi:hypothetical protein
VLKMIVDGFYCDRPVRMVATVGEWITEAGTPGSGATESPAG